MAEHVRKEIGPGDMKFLELTAKEMQVLQIQDLNGDQIAIVAVVGGINEAVTEKHWTMSVCRSPRRSGMVQLTSGWRRFVAEKSLGPGAVVDLYPYSESKVYALCSNGNSNISHRRTPTIPDVDEWTSSEAGRPGKRKGRGRPRRTSLTPQRRSGSLSDHHYTPSAMLEVEEEVSCSPPRLNTVTPKLRKVEEEDTLISLNAKHTDAREMGTNFTSVQTIKDSKIPPKTNISNDVEKPKNQKTKIPETITCGICFVKLEAHHLQAQMTLELPTAFCINHMHNATYNVTLTTKGRTWNVEWDGSKFTNGWKEFVIDKGLEEGDICIFKCSPDQANAFNITCYKKNHGAPF